MCNFRSGNTVHSEFWPEPPLVDSHGLKKKKKKKMPLQNWVMWKYSPKATKQKLPAESHWNLIHGRLVCRLDLSVKRWDLHYSPWQMSQWHMENSLTAEHSHLILNVISLPCVWKGLTGSLWLTKSLQRKKNTKCDSRKEYKPTSCLFSVFVSILSLLKQQSIENCNEQLVGILTQ